MAHGNTYETIETPSQVLQGILESQAHLALEKDERQTYYDLVLSSLPMNLARLLKDDAMTQQYYSPILMEILHKGIEEGREEGREQGRIDGLKASLRMLLQVRGITLSAADEQTLSAETDTRSVENWIRLAAVAMPGQQIFEPH